MPTIPNDEQFVGIASSQDLTERGSYLTNSKRTIYTYVDLKLGAQAALYNGSSTISFKQNEIYRDSSQPLTGNITNDLTDAQLGIVQKIYHQEGTEPQTPAGWVLMGSGTYSTTALNVIYAEWCGGTRVEYWIVQPA